MGALLLALVAAIALFVTEPGRAHAQASSDATLSNLTLNVGELTPAFAAGTYSYTARVSNRTSSIRVTASPNITGSQVRIYSSSSAFSPGDGSSVTGGTLSGHTVSLPVGTTYIGIEVTALDTTSTAVYQVAVERISSGASNDAKLSAFTINTGTLSPGFNPDVTSYTALVPNSAATLEVTPTITVGESSTFVITSNRDSSIDTQASGAATSVDLSVGANVITTKVTAANLETTRTYTLTVTRAAGNASDDARLRSLSLTGITLSPAFKSSEITYTANVPYRTTQTTVTPMVNHSGARATVTAPADSNTLVSGHQLFLGVGATTITVLVTAENAVATQTYTVTVNRAAANASTNANLSALAINAGTLSPGFSGDVTSYTALVSNATTALEVTPTSATGATFVIASDKDSSITTAASGTATSVDLSAGANVITIMVTAADLETTKTYTLTVTRAASTAGDDSRLSTLMVGGESVSVSGFDGSDTTADYSTGVANGVNSMAISATPSHSGAIVAIQTGGGALDPADTGWTVDADGMVDLTIGANNILIEVTAENGSTVSNYFLVITRAEVGASSDAKLSALTINAGTLSPGFDKDVMSYTALVANATTALEITPTITADANSTFVIKSDKDSSITTAASGTATSVDLSAGANVITIMVTAQDYVAMETYTLTVTRAAGNASDDSKLSSLMVGGKSVSVSGFDGSDTTADYSTGVANGVNSMALSATPNHSGAIVVIQTGGGALDPTDPGWTVDEDGMVGLAIGANNILIEVTAENGSTVSNYFLVITRAAASASSDAKLSGLTLSGITISPPFSANTMMYSADVPVNIASTTVTATAATTATSVVIMSDTDDSIGADLNTTDVHITSHSIDLSGGDNVITIMVTAADYETMETYTVTVVRGMSNNAYLSSLSLMDDMGMEVTLIAGVAAHWDTLNCPEMNDRAAMHPMVDRDDLADNMTSPYCAMYDGLSDESKMVLDDVYADDPIEGFMSNIGMYYAGVANDVDMATVSAMAMDSDAMVSGDTGDVDLMVGDNTIEVMVTAEDGTTMMTYTVMVNRAGSSDAYLSSLSLMGSDGMAIGLMDMDGMAVDFSSDTMMYYASVSSDVTMATVSAMAMHSGAMVSGDTGDVDLMVGENTIEVMVTAEDGTMMTYTVMVTVVEPLTDEERLRAEYDTNGDGSIDGAELNSAIDKYLAEELSPSDLNILIDLYLEG